MPFTVNYEKLLVGSQLSFLFFLLIIAINHSTNGIRTQRSLRLSTAAGRHFPSRDNTERVIFSLC